MSTGRRRPDYSCVRGMLCPIFNPVQLASQDDAVGEVRQSSHHWAANDQPIVFPQACQGRETVVRREAFRQSPPSSVHVYRGGGRANTTTNCRPVGDAPFDGGCYKLDMMRQANSVNCLPNFAGTLFDRRLIATP